MYYIVIYFSYMKLLTCLYNFFSYICPFPKQARWHKTKAEYMNRLIILQTPIFSSQLNIFITLSFFLCILFGCLNLEADLKLGFHVCKLVGIKPAADGVIFLSLLPISSLLHIHSTHLAPRLLEKRMIAYLILHIG